MSIIILIGALLPLLLLATLNDLYNYKVSNSIILYGFIVAFIGNVLNYGMNGIITWFIGGITPIAILFLLYLFHMIGASDIKVFSVIGSFLGVSFVIQSMIIAFIIGAVISLIILIRNQNLLSRVHYFLDYLVVTTQSKKIYPYYIKSEDGTKNTFPFTIAISSSVIICIIKKGGAY